MEISGSKLCVQEMDDGGEGMGGNFLREDEKQSSMMTVQGSPLWQIAQP